MEVLIRWPCRLCHQSEEVSCPDCKGKGYLERWVSYLIMRDVRALFSDTFVIGGCRKTSDCIPTSLD